MYEIGFYLDDWDVGFCCDEKLHIEHIDKYDGSTYYECLYPAYWLGQQMKNYCVGYNYCEYNGKHYYTVHHAYVNIREDFPYIYRIAINTHSEIFNRLMNFFEILSPAVNW